MQDGSVPDAEHRLARQAPVLGLFHHSGISNARATAMTLYSGEPFREGQVFAVGGALIADFTRPFGAYKVVGFYYAVKHLKLDKWAVLGRADNETDSMMMRIKNDPLVGYVTERFNVELLPMTSRGMGNDELMQYAEGPSGNPPL